MADSDGWFFSLNDTVSDDSSSEGSDSDDSDLDPSDNNDENYTDNSFFHSSTHRISPDASMNRRLDFYKPQTKSFRDHLMSAPSDDVLKSVKSCLDFMQAKKLNLTTLLWAISWNPDLPQLVADPAVRYARTQLMVSDELPEILDRWHKPPRYHDQGIRTKAAQKSMSNWACSYLCDRVDTEMRALRPFLRLSTKEVSEDSLLGIDIPTLIKDVQVAAPTIWTLFSRAAYTERQSEQNEYKSPELPVLMMISSAAFSRSSRNSKLQKLLTIYFKSCGLSAKAFDTLHALGVTMSQKWAYNGIRHLSQTAHAKLLKELESYPWFGFHDNLNLAYQTYEQRLDNKSHFDSGTATSIVIIKDPDAIPPDTTIAREVFKIGSKNVLSPFDILNLDMLAAPFLRQNSIHVILQFLLDAPDFNFETYYDRCNSCLSAPSAIRQLLRGPEHVTCQRVLPTVKIDESSYDGNDKVLAYCWKEIKVVSNEDKQALSEFVHPWIGDQLTTSRIRGNKKFRSQDMNSFQRMDFIQEEFGWFHALIAIENSLHSQYYGTRAGFGLVHAFDLLGHKGLHAPSVKGTFHHNLQEALLHIAEARVRDLFCRVGKVDSLAKLRELSGDKLLDVATAILDRYASTAALVDHKGLPRQDQDDVFLQSVQLNRDLLFYINVKNAIKSGDVGLLEHSLPPLLYRFVGGRSSNYTQEILENLQGLNREWSKDLSNFITTYCWLTNMTGKKNAWLPIDLLQEHTICDFKDQFAVLEPYASWEFIGSISASIPCQRKVKDHVVNQINHFSRGKKHTSPAKEKDIKLLQEAYFSSGVHDTKPGRQLDAQDRCSDYVEKGYNSQALKKVIARWKSNRITTKPDTEKWPTM